MTPPLRLLVLLTLFLSVVCNAQDLGKDLTKLQNRGINGYFEKNQEVGYTGKVFEKHPNGQIKTLGKLIKGKWDGVVNHWYSDGQKDRETNFKDGKENGLETLWYKNGQKMKEVNWKDGYMDGLWTYWYENGQKAGEVTYKDGRPDGPAFLWQENGQKAGEVTYKDGEEVKGSAKFWNSKGEPVDSVEEAYKK